MTDADLLAAFDDTTLPKELFGHREHVRVAWLYVRAYGVADALTRFPIALKRFATAKGAPTLYHQTITWAYLLAIGERVARADTPDWESFATENGDLLAWRPSLLDRYYTPELLWSEAARRCFVMPDRLATA